MNLGIRDLKQRWDHSLLFLTTIAVFAIAVVIGALFIDITQRVTHERNQQQLDERLAELLDTVENTAAIACSVGDKALAQEVANGLLKNSGVLGATVRSRKEELAHAYRGTSIEKSDVKVLKSRLLREVRFPFNSENVVGEILLDLYPDELERRVGQDVHFVGKLLGLQIAGTSAAIFIVLLLWIVRPIKALSDRLHLMNAPFGERLDIPRGHARTEIGRLANDINALAGHLVSSLEDEYKLRRQHEIGERKYHAIFENAEAGIFIADREGRIESFNSALSRMLGLAAGQQNQKRGRFLTDFPWNSPDRLKQLLGDCLDRKATTSSDLKYSRQDGSARWLHVLCSHVGEEKIQGVITDISERKLAENTVRMQVVTDALTGVANRPGLEQILQDYIGKNSVVPDAGFALMLINLDGFKRVNEALGLPVGDDVLKSAAKRLSSCLKPGDTVARMGGDEFAVILPLATGEDMAGRIGERIIAALAENYEVHESPIQLSASIGITFFPADGNNLPTLLRNAELAMSRAKAGGGNQCAFFDLGMVEAAEQRRALETEMRRALQQNDFRLFYQPIVDVIDNRVVGAEALLRWLHPVNGLVYPDVFVPLAEETGFIKEIGSWVLETACQQLSRWQAEGRDYYVSINVSGRQIADGMSPAMLAATVQRYGISPARLVLEITEGVLMSDVSQALSWLNAVRDQGFRIYLDDFGTGYSSLSYLKRFPVTTVKIDKSFVRDMSSNSNDLALVGAIIAMANSLNLEVVAEGVENMDQLQLLRQKHCRNIQGYYFSKPVVPEEFEATVERIRAQLRCIGTVAGYKELLDRSR